MTGNPIWWHFRGGGRRAGQPVPIEYLAAFNKARDVSSDYFTLEQLVGPHPDVLFAGWNYGLETGTNLTAAEPR